jgi:hypothetical protein
MMMETPMKNCSRLFGLAGICTLGVAAGHPIWRAGSDFAVPEFSTRTS